MAAIQQADGNRTTGPTMSRVDWQCAVNRALQALTADEFEASDVAYADGDTPQEFAQVIVDARCQRLLAEHELAESRALLEAAPTPAMTGLGFFQTLARLRELARCATCGKSTVVLNAGRRGFTAERVTLASHCSCSPDAPAYHLIAAGSGGDISE